jgi:hypothetical protein
MRAAAQPSKNQLLQQATERRHIELFLEMARLRAVIEPGDRPDCVLVLPGRRVGVEHGELYDQDLQAHRPHLRRLEEALQAEMKARSLALHIHVDFPARSSYLVSHPRELKPLARRIAELAARVGRAPDPELVIEGAALTAAGIQGPSRLAFRRSDRASVRMHGGPFQGDGAHRVIEAVRRKEAKLSGYARDLSLSQLWLLLVTGESITQTVASLLIEDLRIESRFDRVYVLDARDRRLLCVKE